MPGASLPDVSMEVALLTEGVDRNDYGGTPGFWRLNVALLAESIHQILSPSGCTHYPFCRPVIGSAGNSLFPCKPAAGPRSASPPLVFFRVGSLLQAPTVQTAEDAARRGEHIGHLIFLHDSGQIPAVAVITQQADPAELCCKVHLLR